jgi:hypothetical protein
MRRTDRETSVFAAPNVPKLCPDAILPACNDSRAKKDAN